jgi:hypothetical protein
MYPDEIPNIIHAYFKPGLGCKSDLIVFIISDTSSNGGSPPLYFFDLCLVSLSLLLLVCIIYRPDKKEQSKFKS